MDTWDEFKNRVSNHIENNSTFVPPFRGGPYHFIEVDENEIRYAIRNGERKITQRMYEKICLFYEQDQTYSSLYKKFGTSEITMTFLPQMYIYNGWSKYFCVSY